MRAYCAGKAGVPTATLPAPSLQSNVDVDAHIREICIILSAATAAEYEVVKFSTVGTPGATITAGSYKTKEDGTVYTPKSLMKDLYSSTAPTKVSGTVRRVTFPATIGLGVVWTFGDEGIIVPRTSSAGAAHCGIVAVGTGQAPVFHMDWDE